MNDEKKTTAITGLKGFGACMIAFVWHYQHFAPQAGSPFYCVFEPFYVMGARMVEVFFMLSGLGIALGYEEKIQSGNISFGEYIGKRIRKLFPLMWLTLFVTLFLQCIYFHKMGTTFVYPNLDVYHFLLNLFGLQNGVLETQWSYNSPSWYISVLLWCYIAFYFVVNKSKGNHDIQVLKYIIVALIGAAVILSGCKYPILNSLMGRGFACFFMGAVLAKVYQRKADLYAQRIGYAALFFLAIVWILIKRFDYEILGGAMAVVFGIAPALILSVLFVPWLNRLFSLKPVEYLGKISFSIYLWHFPVQCVWKIVDVYFSLEINFSRRIIWLAYAGSVLLLSAVYEKWLAGKINKVDKLFIKG